MNEQYFSELREIYFSDFLVFESCRPITASVSFNGVVGILKSVSLPWGLDSLDSTWSFLLIRLNHGT